MTTLEVSPELLTLHVGEMFFPERMYFTLITSQIRI